MKQLRTPVLAAIAMLTISACGDTRTLRDDDLATMMYRECMGGMPGQWGAEDASAALSDPDTYQTASIDAAAERKYEQRRHEECMEQAAYEDDKEKLNFRVESD